MNNDNRRIASEIVDLFDNFLIQKEISVSCDDVDEELERGENGCRFGLYGMEYHTLIDRIEGMLDNSCSKEVKEEKKILSWNEYFMNLARMAAKRSKDPSTQVGACIIDPKDNRIISLGYNGFPFGCSDNEFPWTKDSEDNKYLYVVHAELNALLSAKRNLNGCKLYITHYPCNECMKAIIQAGIKEIVYDLGYKENTMINYSSTKMAEAAGITIEKYSPVNDDLIEIVDENNPNRECISKTALQYYKDFTSNILDKLISEDGYIIDTGNVFNVMEVASERLDDKIKKHPKLWKKYFMIG